MSDAAVPAMKRAAEYVRMSTDHQRYSIESQKATIADYAAANGLEVVTTYADPGRSGLTIKNRPGLRQLLTDVVEGRHAFSALLVYDVSRWGRFQDTDESAHYEFLLRRAGVRVIYCAEPFVNDGSAIASIVKTIKRTMAGEHSRELSTKVSDGRRRGAAAGYWQGAPVGLGIRRLSVDSDGAVRGELAEYQRKWQTSDRVRLGPGPAEEIAVVQRVFELFAVEGWSQGAIARWLHKKGVRRPYGRAWTQQAVGNMLSNEAYIGVLTTGKFRSVLGGGVEPRPVGDWRRVTGALQPIIARDLFDKAVTLLAVRGRRLDDDAILEALRDLWRREGRLTQALIEQDSRTPSSSVYAKRFGGLINSFKRIGYVPNRSYSFIARQRGLDLWRSAFRAQIMDGFRAAGVTVEPIKRGRLLVNSEVKVAISVLMRTDKGRRGAYWYQSAKSVDRADLCVVLRMGSENTEPLDYLVIPRAAMRGPRVMVRNPPQPPFDRFRHFSLDPLFRLTSQAAVATMCSGGDR